MRLAPLTTLLRVAMDNNKQVCTYHNTQYTFARKFRELCTRLSYTNQALLTVDVLRKHTNSIFASIIVCTSACVCVTIVILGGVWSMPFLAEKFRISLNHLSGGVYVICCSVLNLSMCTYTLCWWLLQNKRNVFPIVPHTYVYNKHMHYTCIVHGLVYACTCTYTVHVHVHVALLLLLTL